MGGRETSKSTAWKPRFDMYEKPKHLDIAGFNPRYSIGEEIAERRGPGQRTFAALGVVARGILHRNSQWGWRFEESEDCALEFCYLQDIDGVACLNPRFIKLYQTASTDEQFRAYASKALKQWMMNVVAEGDYGRLLDRLDSQLKRDDKYDSEQPWYWLKGGPSKHSDATVDSLKPVADQHPVDWPSREDVELDHQQRAQKRWVRDSNGKIHKEKGRGKKFGKGNQFKVWMVAVFTAADGALVVPTVADLVVASCPYLIGDHSNDPQYMRELDEVTENRYSDKTDTTFEEVAYDAVAEDTRYAAMINDPELVEKLKRLGLERAKAYLNNMRFDGSER
ncbi:hypothetical protein [Bifidobacterium catulorum]|nr:hypothetical protein [Bifidobacterium catulorum]